MAENWDNFLEAVPVPQVLIGADDRIIAANALAGQVLGPGLVARHFMSALRHPVLLDCIEAARRGAGSKAEADFTVTGPSRETVYSVVAAPVALATGRAVLVTLMDATDVHAAGAIRRDFVANVSHELRTPLTALIGFIETLRGAARQDPEARDRFLAIMEQEASRMNRLVEDLLSLSRLESQERVRPRDTVDLAGLVRAAVSSLRPISEEAGVTVTIAGAEAEVPIPGDADQLAQVLSNLLGNAIKYGGRGARVTVSLEPRAHVAELRGPGVVLTVADTGEGIDPIHIPRLTERFYRVDTHRSREMGGTGLGLAIVKHVVTRHRGRMKIDSSPGKGSRFTIYLPAK